MLIKHRRAFLALLTFVYATLMFTSVASAQAAVEVGEGTFFVPNPLLVTFLVGGIVPLITGLLAKQSASGGTKTLISAVLSAILGVVVYIVDHSGGFVVSEALMFAGITFIGQISGYYGVWKHTTSESGTFTMALTKNTGIG